jgi:hypothetical protein
VVKMEPIFPMRTQRRARHPFRQFDDVALAIGRVLGRCRSAVLDGELVVVGADGRSRFRPLLARRGHVRFYVFDLLWLDRQDLRGRPLLERKVIPRDLVPVSDARLLYVEHVAEDGARFLRAASALDLGCRRQVCRWRLSIGRGVAVLGKGAQPVILPSCRAWKGPASPV